MGRSDSSARDAARGKRLGGRGILPTALAMGAAALLAGAPAAVAQQQSDPPIPRNKRPVRRPVIDLEEMAKRPRPGQIVPGEPASTDPAAPESEPAAQPTSAPAPTPPAPPSPATSTASTPAATPSTTVPVAAQDPADPVHASVLEVAGPPTQVQWRAVTAPVDEEAEWGTIEAGASLDGRIELRTGLAGVVALDVDNQTALRFGRLSRARLERRITSGRSEIVVHLLRGRVVVEPRALDAAGLAATPVRIVTPAGTAVRRVAVEIAYDAMSGMRETVLKRE